MNDQLRKYLYEIGCELGKLADCLCKESKEETPLNIHGAVKLAMDRIAFNLHQLTAELEEYRFNMLNGNHDETLDLRDIETLHVAMKHLLYGSTYTHNGHDTTLATELYKFDHIITSLYRGGGFDYIHEKDI